MVTRCAPFVSVVVPVYRNGGTLGALHGQIATALAGVAAGFEVVYVDDGCPDDSGAVLDALAVGDDRARVVHLPGNIGQHRAILEGLKRAAGEVVVIIDADLQDPPEAIPVLVERIDAGCDAVFAGRQGRYHQSPVRWMTSRLFKTLQSRLVGLPPDAGSYVALERALVDRLLAMRPGPQTVVAMIGFAAERIGSVPIQRSLRPVGRSAFSSGRRFSLAWRTLFWSARMRLMGRPR